MSSKQPRKQRLARYTAPYHRRHREMSSPIDKGLRERQLSKGFMYPRAMPVKRGDRVMIVRGEGKSKSTTAVSLVDRKARKVYVEGFTYFKSDGTELQRPIDASNLVIINPDWSDIRRRKILNLLKKRTTLVKKKLQRKKLTTVKKKKFLKKLIIPKCLLLN